MDKDAVDFGGVFVGEVARKTVTLRNSGALPTHYSLLQLTSPSQVHVWLIKCKGVGEEGRTSQEGSYVKCRNCGKGIL